jgi:hypothetical protein
MFQDLDSTLAGLLDDAAAPAELRDADVSFETPDRHFAPPRATVNLFLYEVQENRESRDPVPITAKVGDLLVRRRPPLRVDCTYLVTAWSELTGPLKVTAEHQLLSQALIWLSRFGTIPAGFLQGSLADQPFPAPTLVAQMDGGRQAGEFWNALGTPPRPAFTLVVRIAMDLGVDVPEGPPVVTKDLRLQIQDLPGTRERWLEIAGTVRDAASSAGIADAEVTLVEPARATTTDRQGRFRFADLREGAYTLRTVAAGYAVLEKAIVVPATVLNAYDVDLTP